MSNTICMKFNCPWARIEGEIYLLAYLGGITRVVCPAIRQEGGCEHLPEREECIFFHLVGDW
jgi:hypothetical protein